MASTPAIPTSVDYTSRDYYSLREDLIRRLTERLNGTGWTGTDPSDFAIALTEAFAYMGDVLSYYTDRVANETQISTATQRDNVLALAKDLGYTPTGYVQSTGYLSMLTNETTPSAGVPVLPIGTSFSGYVDNGDARVKVVFETTGYPYNRDTAVVYSSGVIPTNTNIVVPIQQGTTNSYSPGVTSSHGQLIGYATGDPEFSIVLPANGPVVDNSVHVYTLTGASTWQEWTQVDHLIDWSPYDTVFSLSDDGYGTVTVTFGDGVTGQVIPPDTAIYAKYLVGGGAIGNVATGTIDTFEFAPSVGLTSSMLQSITNAGVGIGVPSPIGGGADPEDIELVRIMAPQALRTLQRAVTADDYAVLAITTVPSIGKANAVAVSPTLVNLYVAPYLSLDDTSTQTPGFVAGVETPAWAALRATLTSSASPNYFLDKVLLGTTVTVLPPLYSDLTINLAITTYPQFVNSDVKTAVANAMANFMSYNYRSFGETLGPDDLKFYLSQVEGVRTVTVNTIQRTGGSDPYGPNTLTGANNEIFYSLTGAAPSTTVAVTGGSSV